MSHHHDFLENWWPGRPNPDFWHLWNAGRVRGNPHSSVTAVDWTAYDMHKQSSNGQIKIPRLPTGFRFKGAPHAVIIWRLGIGSPSWSSVWQVAVGRLTAVSVEVSVTHTVWSAGCLARCLVATSALRQGRRVGVVYCSGVVSVSCFSGTNVTQWKWHEARQINCVLIHQLWFDFPESVAYAVS